MPPSDSSATFMRALRPKPSPAVLLLVGSRRLRGLPVLVHEASRRVWGLRLRRTEQELAISLPPCCLPPLRKRQRPDCQFSELNTQPTCTPVYASPHTSRCATQNSGPSGSLLLSRRTLVFPASCRFIPAHRNGLLSRSDTCRRWLQRLDQPEPDNLHHAVAFKRSDSVEFIVNPGASLNPVDMHGSSPLDLATM